MTYLRQHVVLTSHAYILSRQTSYVTQAVRMLAAFATGSGEGAFRYRVHHDLYSASLRDLSKKNGVCNKSVSKIKTKQARKFLGFLLSFLSEQEYHVKPVRWSQTALSLIFPPFSPLAFEFGMSANSYYGWIALTPQPELDVAIASR